jgi:hypothetical protein
LVYTVETALSAAILVPAREPITSKPCSKCGEVKVLDDFDRDRRVRDGRRADCIACARARKVAVRARRTPL